MNTTTHFNVLKGLLIQHARHFFLLLLMGGSWLVQPANAQSVVTTNIVLDGNVAINSVIGLQTGTTLYLNAVSNVTSSAYRWTQNGQPLSFTGARLAVTQPGVYIARAGVSGATDSNPESNPVWVVASLLPGGQLMGYVKETVVAQASVVTASGLAQLGVASKQVVTTYADGLGRPVETVQANAAANQQDLISFQTYDAAGNAPLSFLPYARTTAANASALLPIATLRNEQAQFYAGTDRVATDEQPFSTTTTEASPLSRVTKTQRAGDLDYVNQRSMSYQVNEAADQVRRWTLVRGTLPGVDGTALYAAGELAKSVAVDEDGRVSIAFQDQLGRTVLLRKVNKSVTPSQNLDTYTVFDEQGRAAYIVPPGAVAKKATAGQWVITDPVFIKRWLYAYTYDARGRLSTRQFPGALPVYLVYDAYDRPVLTQDGNQREGNTWVFIKYDAQNRPVATGLYAAEKATAAGLQGQVDVGSYSSYEERTSTGDYTLTQSFPAVSVTGTTANATLLSQTYYDDYDLDGNGTADYAYASQGLGSDEPSATTQVRGRVTVQKTRIVLPGKEYGAWLTTALFYDQYGNLVQKRSNNHLNPAASLPDATTLVYRDHGFVPQVLRSLKTQHVSASQSVTVRNRFAYDHVGRLLSVWQQNERNSVPEPEVLVARQIYNALGQLVEKNLHSTDAGTSFLQSVDLAYDINGQLTSINNSALANLGRAYDDDNDVFGMELVRAQNVPGLGNTPRFDGGLSAVRWQVHNPTQQNQPQRERSYRFAYDGVGRLTAATYAASSGYGQWSLEANAYNESGITYDPNGNILSLSRYTKDNNIAPARLIDNLTYSYGTDGGNQLVAVSDQGSSTEGFRDQGTMSVEYPVDDNGNLLRDDNKQVAFYYNVLNKPERQQATPSRSIMYDYAADGTLLRRTVSGVVQQGGTVTKTYDYVDGFVYEGGQNGTPALVSVPTPEGRALVLQSPASQPDYLTYEYHLRDHLGNLRVAFRAQPAPTTLHLTMEPNADEEGEYPRFSEVSDARTSDQAQEQFFSARVKQFQIGPHVRMPAADGDHIKLDLFYRTPSGEQVQPARATAPAVAKMWSRLLTLAPVLLPAQSGATTPEGRPKAWWPGIQLSLGGVLAGPAARQARKLRALHATTLAAASRPSPTIIMPAYVAWNTYDDDGKLLKSGREVLPVTKESTYDWAHGTVNLPVDLSMVTSRVGSIEVFLLNDGAQPVYFDSVTIRHPRPALVISQENHYYPFGLNMKGVAVNTTPAEQTSKAQYNGGSQLEDEALDEGGVYSTPLRTYDPLLGRFQGVDVLADSYASLTPYQFAGNDPINHNDPTGAVVTMDAMGHMNMTGGRGQDSFGFAYQDHGAMDSRGDSGWSGIGAGINIPGLASVGSGMSAFDMHDGMRDQYWLAHTGLSALNDFVGGLNATWDSRHNSFGYYSRFGGTEGFTSGDHTRNVFLASSVVGMAFNAISLAQNIRNGIVSWGQDNAGVIMLVGGGITSIAGLSAGAAEITAVSKAEALVANTMGTRLGYAGFAVTLIGASLEIKSGTWDTHTAVDLAVGVASVISLSLAAPVCFGVGVAVLAYTFYAYNHQQDIDNALGHLNPAFRKP